jgi:hypothetical protein
MNHSRIAGHPHLLSRVGLPAPLICQGSWENALFSLKRAFPIFAAARNRSSPPRCSHVVEWAPRLALALLGLDDYLLLPIPAFVLNFRAMNLSNLTAAQLKHAADLVENIEVLNAKLAAILGSPEAPAATPGKRGPKKGGMSAAGRARIAAAQRARWAKVKSAKSESPKASKPAKRKMSAAGRAAIIAAQKARWAKIKAAKKA